MSARPFTWWWPSSTPGKAAMWAVIGLSSLTVLVAGPFAVINVAFWYLVAVGARFIGIKATHGGGTPSEPTARRGPDRSSEVIAAVGMTIGGLAVMGMVVAAMAYLMAWA